MSILKRSLVPLLLTAAVALPIAGSQAQQQPAPPAPPGPPPMQRQLPSPDVTNRMLEGRIAMIKATLKLNDAQLKLFAPIEDRDTKGQGFTHKMGDIVTVAAPELGALTNRMTASDKAPPWTFGVSHLMRNLARRGLL